MSADLGQHTAWLAEHEAMGFTEIHLHHVGTSRRAFIKAFGDRGMPALSHDQVVIAQRKAELMQWLLYGFVVVAGALNAVQAGCNSSLNKVIEQPIAAALMSRPPSSPPLPWTISAWSVSGSIPSERGECWGAD